MSRNHVKPEQIAGGAKAAATWNAMIDRREAGPCPKCGTTPMGEIKAFGACAVCVNDYLFEDAPPSA